MKADLSMIRLQPIGPRHAEGAGQRRRRGRSIGRTLARYPLPGPSPAPPFQTVRARFGHTAYR